MWFTFCLLLGVLLKRTLSGNILIVNTISSPSHQIWNVAYATGLLQKNHNVTMIFPHRTDNLNYTNFHQIQFEEVNEKIWAALGGDFTFDTTLQKINVFYLYGTKMCELELETDGLKHLLNYPPDFKFDLIVFDMALGNGCLYPLIQRFNYPPTIGINAFLLPSCLSHYFGNHLHPSYLPYHHLEYGMKMDFFERLHNTFFEYLDLSFKYIYELPFVENLNRKYFGEEVDSFEKLQRHIALLLTNINPVLNIPQPVTPNVIPVGGLHARPGKTLPEDLRSILDSSKNGVIVFSMGTNLRSDILFANVQRELLETFAELPYTVLWKYEGELHFKTPKNVIIKDWLPINDILAHENTKLFISHGGALSTQEAMYHGVPVLGIPVLADQHMNIRLLKERQLAVSIPLNELTGESLKRELVELFSNPIFRVNMKDISRRFKGLPETPLQTAVQWTEYAMKFEGGHFLSTPARDLSFFVANSLDILSFLILGLIIVLLVVRCILKKIVLLCGYSKIKQD